MTSRVDAGVFSSCFGGSKNDESTPNQRSGQENLIPYDLSELGKVTNIYVDTKDALNHTENEEDIFSMKVRKGVAVIIAYERFQDPTQYRPGAKKDLTEMYDLFNNKLRYTTYWIENAATYNLKNFLTMVTKQKEVLKAADCLTVVISSHGSQNPVPISRLEKHFPDNFRVYEHFITTYDGEMRTLDIMNAFDENHCRELKNKPKFFFMQTCSSRQGKTLLQSLDKGVEVEVEKKKPKIEPAKFFAPVQSMMDSEDSRQSSMDAKGFKPPTFVIDGKNYNDTTGRKVLLEEEINVVPPPCYHNCMVVMASPSEHVAWSDNDKGGWLLYCMYQVLSNYIRNGHTINLQQAVTEISHMMALSMESNTIEEEFNLMKCVPSVTHMLIKDIILVPPGVLA